MTRAQKAMLAWWFAHLPKYNLGLAAAGVVAFGAYTSVLSLLPPGAPAFTINAVFVELWCFGYLVMMIAANCCYLLGPFLEAYVEPCHPDRFRRIAFGLGFWFSMIVPLYPSVRLVFRLAIGAPAEALVD